MSRTHRRQWLRDRRREIKHLLRLWRDLLRFHGIPDRWSHQPLPTRTAEERKEEAQERRERRKHFAATYSEACTDSQDRPTQPRTRAFKRAAEKAVRYAEKYDAGVYGDKEPRRLRKAKRVVANYMEGVMR